MPAQCVASLHNAVNYILQKKNALLYIDTMALGSQLPVRLPPDIEDRIEKVAMRLGTTKSALIRMLAKTFVEQVVDEDGQVQLPPKWRKLLDAADGRASYSLHEPDMSAVPAPATIKKGARVSNLRTRQRTKAAASKE